MRSLVKLMALSLVLIGVAAIPFLALSRQPAAAQSSAAPRSINVTGNAEVRVVPDEVVLTFGVETWDKVLSAAKSQNDERVQKIIAVAKEQGVPAERIQTDFISIDPRYQDGYARQDFIGYFVRKTIVITLRDVAKFDALLSGALEAGATHVHGVQFQTTELRKHRDSARSLAIKAAREKAEALAGELGLKIGRATNIQENQLWWWSSYSSWWGYRGGPQSQNVVQNAAGSGAPSDSETTIAPGQIAVSATVTVTFEME